MKFLHEKWWTANVRYQIIVHKYKQINADWKHICIVAEQSKQSSGYTQAVGKINLPASSLFPNQYP